MDTKTITELAQDWIGASLERPVAGERIDRQQLAEQLRAAGDNISNGQVEAVAREIQRLSGKLEVIGDTDVTGWSEADKEALRTHNERVFNPDVDAESLY